MFSDEYCGAYNLQADSTPKNHTSPLYPNKYVNNIGCEWLINTTSPNERIALTVLELETSNDFLTVYDGPNSNDIIITRLNGTIATQTWVSTGPSMYLEFSPDDLNTAKGFILQYQTFNLSQGFYFITAQKYHSTLN